MNQHQALERKSRASLASLGGGVISALPALEDERRLPWLEHIEAVLRRWRMFLAVFMTVVLLAALAAWLEPTLYRAVTRIQLTAHPLAGPRVEAMTDRQILAEVDMLKSPGLLRTMLDDATVAEGASPADAGLVSRVRRTTGRVLRAPFRFLDGSVGIAPQDRQIQRWAAGIDIARVANSNVVAVAYTDEDPQAAAVFVNSLLAHHIERIATLGESNEARSFYAEQAELLAEEWRKANETLLTFKREHGADVSEAEIQRTLSSLEAQRVATETQALELEATIGFLSKQMAAIPATVEGELLEKRDASVDLLKSKLLELQIRRIEALASYTEDSTIVRDYDRQISQIQGLLTANANQIVEETLIEPNPSHQALEVNLLQTEARLNAAEARLRALNTQLAVYREKRTRIEPLVGELNRLQSAANSAKEDHETYLKRVESARLGSALGASGRVNVTIIERAEPPLSPLPSNRKKTLLFGVAAGLMLGVAGAFARDLLDPTVKSSRQVARLTGLPVLAKIPSATASTDTT